MFIVFFFFFFLAKGTWQVKKIYRNKAKLANSSKVLSCKFLVFFPITDSLSAHKTKRRCHSSSLDEYCVFLIILIMKLESKLSLLLSFTNSLTVPPEVTDLVILKGQDKKRQILYSCWFPLPCVTMESITMVLGMEQSKSSTDLINDAY